MSRWRSSSASRSRRALARDARVFLFDEPNSALTQEESNDLFRRMHALADAGRVVLLVSHRIAELAEHADRVALILDGACTDLLERRGADPGGDRGRARRAARPARERRRTRSSRRIETRGTALRLTGWTHAGGEFAGIDLHVQAGEIVAIVGVEGSGARELVRSIAGFERHDGDDRGRLARRGVAP